MYIVCQRQKQLTWVLCALYVAVCTVGHFILRTIQLVTHIRVGTMGNLCVTPSTGS
jgi:hypothetical protein